MQSRIEEQPLTARRTRRAIGHDRLGTHGRPTWCAGCCAADTAASCSTAARTRSRHWPARALSAPRRSTIWSANSPSPARSGSWCPPAIRPNRPSRPWPSGCTPGDTIIDGGNSYFKDDVRRAKALRPEGHPLPRRGHQRRRLGARTRLLPDDRRPRGSRPAPRSDLQDARPRPRRSSARPAASRLGGTRRGGLSPLRPRRRGPFRQDGPQRHRIRPDAGLRRGFRHPARRPSRRTCPQERRYQLNLADIAEVWRRGSVIGSWLLDLTAMALAEDPTLVEVHRRRARLGRRALDRRGRRRGGRAGRGADFGPLHPLPLPRGARLRRRCSSAMRYKFGGHIERPGGGR